MASTSSSAEDGAALVRLTNDMLSQLHVSLRVKHWTEINAQIFVTLFEGLCGETLQDVIRNPVSWEDRVHNVQTVIDTLSLDVLNTSLSHITGESVVNGSIHDIGNLLEVFSGLLDYILERIGSDTSTDNEDDLGRYTEEDPDLVTPAFIDSILERELGRSHRENSGAAHHRSHLSHDADTTKDLIALGQNSQLELSTRSSANNTADLIALGESRLQRSPKRPESKRSPKKPGTQYSPKKSGTQLSPKKSGTRRSPKKPDSRNASFQNGGNLSGFHSTYTEQSTQDMIRESEALDRYLNGANLTGPRMSPPSLRKNAAPVASHPPVVSAGQPRSLSPTSLSSGSYMGITEEAVRGAMASAPRGTRRRDVLAESLPMATSAIPHTVQPGLLTYPAPRAFHESLRANLSHPGNQSNSTKPAGSKSMESLTSLMENTAAMARQAVSTSPLRNEVPKQAKAGPTKTSPDIDGHLSDALRSTLRNVHKESSELVHLASSAPSSPNRIQMDASHQSSHKDTSVQSVQTSPNKDRHHTRRRVCFDTGRLSDEHTSSDSVPFETSRKGKTASKSYGAKKTHSGPVQDNTQPAASTRPLSASHPAPKNRRPQPRSVADQLAPRRQMDTHQLYDDGNPKTFQEYLDKYYRTTDARDGLAEDSQDDSMRHSDSELDYSEHEHRHRMDGSSHDADLSQNDDGDAAAEFDVSNDADLQAMQRDLAWLRSQIRARKTVHFEDILDDSAPGHMDGLRHKLTQEERKSRGKADTLGRMYEYELQDYTDQYQDDIRDVRRKAKTTEKEYKKKVLHPPKTKFKAAKKYGVGVTSTYGVPSRSKSKPRPTRGRKRSVSASPTVGRKRAQEPDLLPFLLEEFPFLHLSTETLHELWRRSAQQMEQLSRAEQEVKRKKSKAQVQIEEAERRQKILLDIMKKELSHNQRMKDLKERQQQQQLVKSSLREKRQQSARARKYYDEFQVRMRSKMLRKRTREEAIFKSLFKDGLSIQKERIRDLRRYAKEQREFRNKRQQDELENLENYYRDQFSMLAESMENEKKDLNVRDKAQSKVLQQMKSELRRKMESEIRNFQEQLYRDEDEEYFRQLDADRLRHTLQMARFQAHV